MEKGIFKNMNFYAKELLTDGTEKIHSFSSEKDRELFIAQKLLQNAVPVVLKVSKHKAMVISRENF